MSDYKSGGAIMNYTSLADIDELAVRCRNQSSKKYIAEAVACYKNGAYRACIVATWIALSFDFISKIKELSLTGDKAAKQKEAEFEQIRKKDDVSASLLFEKNILTMALKDFDFVSPVEYKELIRLFEDRNRCAHPSMLSSEETYMPSAELARYHLRNAVVYFLQRPPVQGKAAIDKIMKEIDSEYFPVDYELAEKHFRSGPLARAKDSLIRNVIIMLSKNLLSEQHTSSWRDKRKAALMAMRRIYSQHFEDTIKDALPKIIDAVQETDLEYVIDYISMHPMSWDFIGDDKKIKIMQFIEKTKSGTSVAYAFNIAELKDVAVLRLAALDERNLGEFIKMKPVSEVTALAVKWFSGSRSYASASFNFSTLVLPLHSVFSLDEKKQILRAFGENDQIYPARGIIDMYLEFLKLTENVFEDIKEDWNVLYQQYLDRLGYESELQNALKAKFPNVTTASEG